MTEMNALYRTLLAADEADDAVALSAVAWQMYGQLATTTADLGALRARFRVYAAAPHDSGRLRPAHQQRRPVLPGTGDPELFFAESPDDAETAKLSAQAASQNLFLKQHCMS